MKKAVKKIVGKSLSSVRKSKKILEKGKVAGRNFKREFKKQIITAITAAFAFLVALSWREPISDLVNKIIIEAGLKRSVVYFKFLSALIVTLIAVFALMIISKWGSKES